MKKIILILAVGFALLANADYIYWMVDNPASGTDITGAPTSFSDWAYAVLTVQDSSAIYVNSTYAEASSAAASVGGTLTGAQASRLSSYDAYAYANVGSINPDKYFLIELFAGDGTWMAGYSESAKSSAIAQYIFSDNSMSVMPAQGFGQGATYAVPEPTSGLLFLIGGVLLGLKRRRQQV